MLHIILYYTIEVTSFPYLNMTAFTDASLVPGGGIGELPEADQDFEEPELPQLPPSKDPSGQTITNTLLTRGKSKSSPKQMVPNDY